MRPRTCCPAGGSRNQNSNTTPPASCISLTAYIRSLEANVQGFEERASKLEYDITDATKRAKELETKVGAHFEREERYQQLTRRQSEIEEKLDLTKNQAPSQVDADAPDANEQKNSEKQTQTHSPRPKRRAAIRV